MLYQILLCENDVQCVEARELIAEYAKWLDVDLCFQNFSAEMERLGQIYTPLAGGVMLLVLCNDKVVGIGGLKRLSQTECEMKRVYIQPEHRGVGMGRQLIEALIQSAVSFGYESVLLSTLPKMERALHLYQTLGFATREAYGFNPVKETIYMTLPLEGQEYALEKLVHFAATI